ncbi:MAG TPA: NfeD family protein [Roseococcus sp.]|nr:NfeD family protein [Roseococcus sp.]
MSGLAWPALLIAALVALAAEMLLPALFFLWVGLGLLAAALVAWWGHGLAAQVGAFLLGLAGGIAAQFLRRRRAAGPDVSAPQAVLLGQRGTALGRLDPDGRVRLGDGSWAARAADGTPIPRGAAVRVIGIDGATLLVAAADRAG